MPEGPEITILSQYLLENLKDKKIKKIQILSGKYLKKGIKGLDLIQNKNYKILNIHSKGKLMWFELENNYCMTSHLGLSGFWNFEKSDNDRVRINIVNGKDIETLCYEDPRNFGNIEILTKKQLDEKLLDLATDALKEEFTNEDFQEKIKEYLSVSKSRHEQKIFKVLMNQKKKDGLVSGLGNYLTPEILYHCKLSPFREIGTLTKKEINNLTYSIKYIIKLSYYNNVTGYMTNFDNFIQIHKTKIDNKIYPEYHPDIKLKKTDKFKFNVYQQKTDSNGNVVEPNKELNKGRTTYWVPTIQK